MVIGKSDSDICFFKFVVLIDFKCVCICMSVFIIEVCVKLRKNCYKSGYFGGKINIKKNIFFFEVFIFFNNFFFYISCCD